MKKLIFIMAGLIIVSVMNAQSLEEIVKKYTEASKLDNVANIKTIKITASMSVMGMELPMTMWMKNPDKMKSVTSINGQDMIQVFDGTKGYSVNPMTGSSDPVEMTPEQIKQTQRSNMFKNYLADALKKGELTLEGEENVNDKPAFKLKYESEGVITYLDIDKSTYYVVKTSTTSNGMAVESYPTDYTETNGVVIPMKTSTSAQGMDMVMTFTKVEVDTPIEDSLFVPK
jgi:outer membrane lipoprotein-sorting protein